MEYQWNGETLEASSAATGIRTTISALSGLLGTSSLLGDGDGGDDGNDGGGAMAMEQVVQMLEDYWWKIRRDAKDLRKRAKHIKEARRRDIGLAAKSLKQKFSHQRVLHTTISATMLQLISTKRPTIMVTQRYYVSLGASGMDHSFHTPMWVILLEHLPLRFYLGVCRPPSAALHSKQASKQTKRTNKGLFARLVMRPQRCTLPG